MSTSTKIKIDGAWANPAEIDLWPANLNLRVAGYSTLSLVRRGGTLPPATADAVLNKRVELYIDDEIKFAGVVISRRVDYSDVGWVRTYQANCLRYVADQRPFIDSNTGGTTAAYNLPPDDALYFASRAGRNVGEVVADCLTMSTNAAHLHAAGIGGYTVVGDTYSLPAETLADLAALDLRPPQVLQVSGAKCLTAIESFVQSVVANCYMIVRPDGVIRFIKQGDFVEETLTLDDETHLLSPPSIDYSIAECSTAVEIVGQRRTEAKLLALSNGGLEEDFAVGSWTPADYYQSRESRSQGTVEVLSTLTARITPADPTQSWGVNDLDQSHWAGTISFSVEVVSGINSLVTRRVISNTALTAGGSCTVTLDAPLPATDYTQYYLYAYNVGASLVYRRYRITDTEITAALAREFSPSAVFVFAGGNAAQVTNFPMGSVCTGSAPPYNEVSDTDHTLDLDGTVTFTVPTYIKAGNIVPADVRVLVPVNTGVLSVRAPETGYAGTAYTTEGVERTLQIYQRDWRDESLNTSQAEYAQSLLDSVKNVVVDCNFKVDRLWPEALTLGTSVSIAGNGYSTGLEAAKLPITEVSLAWNINSPSHHTTTIQASNRTAAQPQLLPPERPRQGYTFGPSGGEAINPFVKPGSEQGGVK
jgi:hypothetical protein